MDLILGIIFLVVVLAAELAVPVINKQLKAPALDKYIALGQSVASKIVVAFLAGFCIFVLFTDKVPKSGQKIPIIIAAGLLIWVNIFLGHPQEKEELETRQKES